MFRQMTLITTVVLFKLHVRVEAEGVVNSFASKQGEPMLDPPHMLYECYPTDTLSPAPHPEVRRHYFPHPIRVGVYLVWDGGYTDVLAMCARHIHVYLEKEKHRTTTISSLHPFTTTSSSPAIPRHHTLHHHPSTHSDFLPRVGCLEEEADERHLPP